MSPSSACPNCGNRMVMLRRERQRAAEREIILDWGICVECKHVRLDSWRFIEATVMQDGRRCERGR